VKKIFSRFVAWLRSLFRPAPAPEVITVPASPVWVEPDRIKPTKAYADQRQKMPHNRKRKPKKAMRNLYQLA
jgi:hypothetical protein